ncbi:hypothetical protein [Anaeromusa sp.]|uniref:hypothetical protein n=1 Tax=Anaeromusa sp. TaxID=1872520 RepID=UPI0026203ED9|nr:hypothetical protein [Anaeromusa sp.]MDD3157026.1 hypothetical protein [Anaeromusa sp.]
MKPNAFAQNSKLATPNMVIDGIVGVDVGDYGSSFSGYTPPSLSDSGVETDIRLVNNTNATTPASRLYVYGGGLWRYLQFGATDPVFLATIDGGTIF